MPSQSSAPLSRRDAIARRAAEDLPDGAYVNLGIGLPTLVAQFVSPNREVVFHSENGLLGVGPPPSDDDGDPELINAGKERVTLLPGASIFDHALSFAMIRGGHLDVALLGAFQVAPNGDLANWATPDPAKPPAVGGAMDLAVGAKQVWVLVELVAKNGEPRLVNRCTYPLTAAGVVKRIYSDVAVIDVGPGFVVRELDPALTPAALQAMTQAPLTFAANLTELRR